MEIFDTMILDIILIALPLTIYLLYLAYTKTFNNKENELLIVVTIFSVLYLLFKYTKPLYMNMPFIIINISLIIAYIKKSKISVLITSIIMIAYYYSFYQDYLPIIILEYLLYYLFYLKTFKEFKINNFILIFATIKIVITLILLSYQNYAFPAYVSELIIEGIYLYAVSQNNIMAYSGVLCRHIFCVNINTLVDNPKSASRNFNPSAFRRTNVGSNIYGHGLHHQPDVQTRSDYFCRRLWNINIYHSLL